MRICLYKDGVSTGSVDLPDEVFQACVTLDGWFARQNGDISIYGFGRPIDRDARIAELEKENKLLRAQLELADALRNHKRSKPE